MDDKFVRPDREATAKSMRLEERGTEQGELDLPRTAGEDFDVIERQIIAEVREHLDGSHIDTCNHLRVYEGRLAELHLLHGLGSIRSETKKTLGDLKALVAEWSDRLSNRRDAVRASYAELTDFQARHRLNRPVRHTEARSVHLLWILLAWLLETGGNAIFLSENNEMGVAGGVFAAALVAGINVLFATVAGIYLFRRTKLPSPAARGAAWIGVAVWLVVMSLWNIGAGHFRDAQAAGVANPQLAAMQLVASAPFHFDGLYSWGMVLIGFMAAALSANQAFEMDDPFPGYGALGRQHTNRCAEYADLVAEARDKLAKERNRAIEIAEEVKDELQAQLRVRGQILSGHARMVVRFRQHEKQLEELTNYLLKVYRDANSRARQSKAPERFERPIDFEPLDLPPLQEPALDQAKIAASDAALNQAIDEVTVAFDRSIDSFTPLDELKRSLEDGSV